MAVAEAEIIRAISGSMVISAKQALSQAEITSRNGMETYVDTYLFKDAKYVLNVTLTRASKDTKSVSLYFLVSGISRDVAKLLLQRVFDALGNNKVHHYFREVEDADVQSVSLKTIKTTDIAVSFSVFENKDFEEASEGEPYTIQVKEGKSESQYRASLADVIKSEIHGAMNEDGPKVHPDPNEVAIYANFIFQAGQKFVIHARYHMKNHNAHRRLKIVVEGLYHTAFRELMLKLQYTLTDTRAKSILADLDRPENSKGKSPKSKGPKESETIETMYNTLPTHAWTRLRKPQRGEDGHQ
eukprot:Platyproteum_vivax@DN5980_c0_g1_i4.p1